MTREKYIVKVPLKSVGEKDVNGDMFTPNALRKIEEDFKEGDSPIKTTLEGNKIIDMEYIGITGTLFAFVELDEPPQEFQPTATTKGREDNPKMTEKRAWAEFREAGMLWFVNRLLHLFGWAIAVELNSETEEIDSCYPVRCKFRGFDPELEEKGFGKVTDFLAENIDELKKDLTL